MTTTCSSKEFDKWAPDYDSDVHSTGFPFSCYEKTFNQIIKIAMPKPEMQILDLGVGTGNLTARFLDAGCNVTGVDFSSKMISIAKSKYPAAFYVKANLRSKPSHLFSGKKFDRIVSAYTFHHFPLPEKYLILRKFMPF